MRLLDKTAYYKAEQPLMEMVINNLFARTVVEKRVDGSIYVDNAETPTTFYVVHPYGMSLLFGEHCNDDFNTRFLDYALNTFRKRNKDEWLQAYPNSWNTKLSILFKDTTIKEDTRINFRFNKEKYLDFKSKVIKKSLKISRTNIEMFEIIEGSVVPKYFWRNAEHFFNYGVGYSLVYENRLASTAFSSFIHGNKLEVGIETSESYRGMGFAKYVCSSLIDYCLDNDYEPIWSCRLENFESAKLAESLGFEPTLWIPYYRLKT